MKIGLVGMVLGSALMVGCSSMAVRDSDADTHSMREEARGVTIRKGDGSGVVSWDEVVADMASADVVLFGEMHGHPLGLAIAQEMWEDLLVERPTAVLSMEFYERDQQLALDEYLEGVTDRPQFEKAAKKDKGNNPPGHKRMIDAAKEAHRPVMAANAPRRYVTIGRKKGYETLEALDGLPRTMFELPMGDQEGAYKDRFMELMSGMVGHDSDDIAAGMFRSQSVWDATMGDSIVDGLKLGSPVAHVVGYFHVQFGGEPGGSGLIDQIRVRNDRPLKIVTIIPLARDDQSLRMGSDDVLGEDGEVVEEGEASDVGIADYVVYVGAGDR
jgi:uncharacterized iron-regulated protein